MRESIHNEWESNEEEVGKGERERSIVVRGC